MHKTSPKNCAFTFVELLVVLAIIAVLVVMQLPAIASTKTNVQRVNCSDNLKRVGFAFRSWAGSHNDRMPMQVSSSEGGAFRAVGLRATGGTFASNMSPTRRGVFGMFVVMSNELITPKILYCPSEYRANILQGSVFGDTSGTNIGFFNDNGTSYFVGVDAIDLRPGMFLTGDHNIGAGATPPAPVNIYGDSVNNFVSLGTNTSWSNTSPGWGANQHLNQGNVTFMDGSVHNLTTDQLRAALNRTGDTGRPAGFFVQATGSFGSGVNRLQFP